MSTNKEKRMWELFPEFWKTESSFMSFVRNGIRNGLWKKHRVKLKFLEDNVQLVKNTNPRSKKRFPMVRKWRCSMCEGMFGSKEIEVDHRIGEHSLRSMDDLDSFVHAMIFVTEDDLDLLCKDCHALKTMSERGGISIEESRATKVAIQLIKDKEEKGWLEERGIPPASNQKARREQIIEYLKDNVDE